MDNTISIRKNNNIVPVSQPDLPPQPHPYIYIHTYMRAYTHRYVYSSGKVCFLLIHTYIVHTYSDKFLDH